MSCQQVSRLITTATTSVSSEDQDPYVFTETVPTTPPILFNTQKTRSRVFIDAQAVTSTSTPTPTPTPTPIPTPAVTTTAPTIAIPTAATLTLVTATANKRPQTAIVTTNAKLKFNQKLPLGPLNGNNTKTQAVSTLAAATAHNGPTAATTAKTVLPTAVKTTNSLSQRQQQQQQQHQHKKALNVCIVRPQQQQQQLTTTVRPHYKAQQQRKQVSSPPPLLQHTPSLWQTPLLLNTASAVVSPPTSPASLPSPPLATAFTPAPVPSPTAAATAMVSPLVAVSAAPLPPSKFHHNTLAQHLQKVECIKKPKKSIAVVEFQSQQNIQEQQAVLKPQQPQQHQQRCDAGTRTVVVQPTSALLHAHVTQQPQAQAKMNKPIVATTSAPPPLQAIQAVSPPQHSDSDLNEIPVNVIFRKPQASEILHSQLGDSVSVTALGKAVSRSSGESGKTMVNSRSSAVEAFKKNTTYMKAKNVKIISSNMQSKPASASAVLTETAAVTPPSLRPAPHVLRDIVFTHPGPAKITQSNDAFTTPAHTYSAPYQPPAAMPKPQQNMSSMAKPPPPQPPQPLNYDTTSPAQYVRKPVTGVKNIRAEEKCAQKITDAHKVMAAVKANTVAVKHAPKPKATATPTVSRSNNALQTFIKKRSRKMGPLHSACDNQMLTNGTTLIESSSNGQNKGNCRAVAVVKMATAEIEADTTLLASATVLPYCMQKHWLYITREIQLVGSVCVVATATGKGVGNLDAILAPTASERESRITQRKTLLRRQALQLLSTHSLQKLPMQAAKRRLMCVDRLLQKYERHGTDDITTHNKCNVVGCSKSVLEMALQCEDHIVDNISQHIFLPCTAKFADNTQCRIPVFDVIHDLPLCQEHSRKRDAYNQNVHDQQAGIQKLADSAIATTQPSLDCDAGDLLLQLQKIQHKHKQQQQQRQIYKQQDLYNTVGKSKKSGNAKVTATRKRKAPNAAATVGRPQKRPRKVGVNGTPTTPVVAAAVAPLQLTSAVLQRKSSTTSLESIASNSQSSNSQPHYISSTMNAQVQGKIAMPALAPLSGRNAPVVSSTVSPVSAPKRKLNFSTVSGSDNGTTLLGSDVMSQDLKPHEINQLVAQFSVAVNNNNNNNTNNNENSNSLNAYSNSSINNCYNYISANCDSNFTSALGSSSSLPSSTEELFRQELLSVCENSSAYASSEDTGLGGLSETELMVGPNDADDIPLGDTRLLEEHDLANVLSALPEDAFNELFTAVHQEEREEVERALELADKHLKSLQQTIGSDIHFLEDFPGDDEILADTDAMCSKMDIVSSVMGSPDATSGIDTSTLFIDSGSNSAGGGGGGSVHSNNIADIRGLVQT